MKFNKLFAITAFVVVLAMCVPFCGFLTAMAANDEEFDKWDLLEPAYMSAPYKSIVERIYADGPDADLKTGSIPSMKLIYPSKGVDEPVDYALYVDQYTGEVICLKLVDRNGDGVMDTHPDYADKYIYYISDNTGDGSSSGSAKDEPTAVIYDYCGKWSTNPYNIGSSKIGGNDVSAAKKAELYSQLRISYVNNGLAQEYYSFQESALYDQIKVSGIKNGARVEYAVGQQAVKYLVPFFITEAKFTALMEKVDAGLRTTYPEDRYYEFYSGRAKANFTLYTPSNISGQPEYIVNAVNRLGNCYLFDLRQGKGVLPDLEGWIKEYTDYSYEQLDEDHAETGYTVATEIPASFKLAIEYTFDEYGMSVRCSAGNIRFDSASFQLDDVHLLPFAGAGDTNNSGYALYPDGSGAIVDFKDAKGKTFTFVTTAYGADYSFSSISGAKNEVARLPVFGMTEVVEGEDGKKTASGYLAYVEEGDSLADISVSSSGTHPFLQAYTKFNPRPTDTYSLTGGISSGSTMWTVEAKRKYTRNYKLRVFILDEDDASYSAMANTLREYFVSKGIISPIEEKEETDIPLVIETLGAIEVTESVLGVPYSTMHALTTFEDIKKNIIGKLQGDGVPNAIDNIVIKLNGWLDGGLDYNVPSGIEIEEAVGGDSGFKDLVSYCNKNGITLYPDFDFTFSRVDEMFDGFDADDDLARTIDDRRAYKKVYNPVYQTYDYSPLGVISTNRMMHFYTETYSDYKKYNVGSIAVSTLGQYLNSDFNEDKPLNREDSKVLVDRLLNTISENNDNVLLSGGNIFTVKYADLILDVPLEDSLLRYTTTEIPFYSMVLHGSVEYSGTALNLAGDYESTVLKTIESGAVPYFIVAVQNTSDLKNDESYSEYYSVRYNIWLEDIYDTYHKVNDVLSNVKYSKIVKHEFLDSYYDVVRVTYDNGYSVIVNYGDSDYTFRDKGVYTVDASGVMLFKDGAPVASDDKE